MKILLTGGNGQVGWELRRTLACLGEVVAMDSKTLDLTDVAAIRRVVGEIAPRIIVNSAAHTAVDRAESESDLAYAVNATAPGVLALEAEKLGALLVHYSTDYVFDGSGETSWREDDATGPLNVYGASKLAGEQAIQAACRRHLIFRTSWVYGARGANFLLTTLENLKVSRWLSPTDESAAAALANPTLTFTVAEETCDEEGETTGNSIRTLTLAPATQGSEPASYFGRLTSDAHPFLITRDTYQKLAGEVLEKP